MKQYTKRVLSLLLVFVMVLGMLPAAAFAAQGTPAPQYDFGPAGAQAKLIPGIYKLPIRMMHADKDKPSMAAECVKGSSLEVLSDGTAYTTVDLGPKSAYGITTYAINWKIYQEYNTTSQLVDAKVTKRDGEGHVIQICFPMPFTNQPGVFTQISVDMGLGSGLVNPDARLLMDFKTATHDNAAEAKKIDAQIAALGEVTLTSEAAIGEARNSYDWLIPESQKLVKNLSVLEAAEAKLQELKDAAAQAELDKAAAAEVDAKIAALGEITLESKDAVKAARTAYGALTEPQKAQVKNIDVLTAAEAKLDDLQGAADQDAAAAVDAKIAAIGEVTLASEAAIKEARAAYTALTDVQKTLVRNLATLEAAEAKLVELKKPHLAEGSYLVPIKSLTSGAPIPAVATEFAKSFGTEVQLDVAADGTMTATIVPQHMVVNVNGSYHCNILKVRSAAGEAAYPEMKTELVTPTFGKPEVTQNIQCPAKAVVVLPAANAEGAYPLEVTADFMNGMNGGLEKDHWMDVALTLDFASAKPAQPAGPSFEFGTAKTVLTPGKYTIPTALMHADHHEKPSMAAKAILGGELEVMENGDAYVNVKLGPVDAYGMHGWSTNWKVYDVYQCESQLPDDPKTLPLTEAEIVSTAVENGETYPSEIRFKLPFTDKDGVYATMFVPVMTAYPNGFLSLDFANAKPVAPVAPKFDLVGANVILGNDLDMMFAIPGSAVADWSGCKAVITRTYADGRANDVVTVPFADWQKNNAFWVVTYQGLAAKEMCDEITVVVLDKNEREISNPWTDSMRAYAMRTLHSDPSAATVIVDMLNYGAEAQSFFHYNEKDLANSQLSEEQKLHASELQPMESGLKHGDKWSASNLIAKSNIQLMLAYQGLSADMSAKVEFTKYNGKKISAEIPGSAFLDVSSQEKAVVIDQLVVADARQIVTVTIYNADGSLYTTSQESIEDYLARGTHENVYDALMKFADSARVFLTK